MNGDAKRFNESGPIDEASAYSRQINVRVMGSARAHVQLTASVETINVYANQIAKLNDQIGKLAAIAVLRTALNFFLSKEIRDTEHEGEGRRTDQS